VSWTRYHLQRRFTPAGAAVLGGVALAFMMGADTENNVAYQGFSVLAALLVVAAACSLFFRGRFAVTRHLPRFGTVGFPVSYLVTVRNLGSKPQIGLSLLETFADPRPSYEEWLSAQMDQENQVQSFRFSQARRTHPFHSVGAKAVPAPALGPGGAVDVKVELTPLRRGVLRFQGVTLARPDPIGLVRAFVKVPLAQSMLILPRRYPLPPIALPGTTRYQQGGVAMASSVGQSEDFVALRDYRHGDPLRHIHWRSWAKIDKPVVKEFEDEFFVRHALVLDTFTPYPRSVLFEEAVSVAASFACTIPNQESLLDLLFVGTKSYCFTAGRGLAHADQMLEILASVQAGRGQTFAALENLVLEHIEAVSGCICVLLAWDKERRELVRKLNQLGIPLLVLVLVHPGRAESLEPGPMRDQPERFHAIEVDKVEQALAKLR
jgi:uncharacterized protein (DUF58 family)